MRMHGISDADADALVTGVAPVGRPDLATLARSIAEFRGAAYASPPRPSAALRARLELASETEISPAADSVRPGGTIGARTPTEARSATSMGRVKRTFAWFTGLGIAAKVVLGVSVAAAAGATGVGTAVGIGTLVAATSEQEQVAPVDEPADAPADDPTEAPEILGGSVSDRTPELGADGDGAAFDEEVSEHAQQLGADKAHDLDGTVLDESGFEDAENGLGNAPELPDVVPGGDD